MLLLQLISMHFFLYAITQSIRNECLINWTSQGSRCVLQRAARTINKVCKFPPLFFPRWSVKYHKFPMWNDWCNIEGKKLASCTFCFVGLGTMTRIERGFGGASPLAARVHSSLALCKHAFVYIRVCGRVADWLEGWIDGLAMAAAIVVKWNIHAAASVLTLTLAEVFPDRPKARTCVNLWQHPDMHASIQTPIHWRSEDHHCPARTQLLLAGHEQRGFRWKEGGRILLLYPLPLPVAWTWTSSVIMKVCSRKFRFRPPSTQSVPFGAFFAQCSDPIWFNCCCCSAR